MPPIRLTPIQLRFFNAIVEGKSQAEAYKAAKFPRGGCSLSQQVLRKRGSEMENTGRMRVALASARAASVEAASITIDTIVRQLLESREIALAQDPPQVSASVAATAALAKVCGLWIDRKVVGVVHKPGLSSKAVELTREEWERQFTPMLKSVPVAKSAP